MSERVVEKKQQEEGGPQQRSGNKNEPIYVHKPKRGGNKPGKDRRFTMRNREFEDNSKLKMDGIEVPKTLKVSISLLSLKRKS